MPELDVRDICKEFPTRTDPLVVLRNITFAVSRGESVAIVGPSGSGKSTLLHVLGTLDPPTSGTVTLDGEDPFGLSPKRLAAFRNHNIGFVFQDHHLLPQLTALENVLVPTLATGRAGDEQIKQANSLLESVGLSERRDHRPAELSGGERQRVAIARALLNEPTLLLADEPTGNLDRTNAQSTAALLLDLQSALNTILIVVTHSQEVAQLMQRRFELDDGKLIQR